MSQMDRVWLRLKEIADRIAAEERPFNVGRARQIVRQLVASEHMGHPPADALEYLSGELMSRVADARRGRAEPVKTGG